MKANQRSIKIGIHRDKPRLWLEGTWLGMVGFQRGTRFTATFKPGSIALRTIENGDDPGALGARLVSGKTKNSRDVSVIDINSLDLPFSGTAVVTVKRHGLIVITPEPK